MPNHEHEPKHERNEKQGTHETASLREHEQQERSRAEREQAAENQPDRRGEIVHEARKEAQEEALPAEKVVPTETVNDDEPVLAVTHELRTEVWHRSMHTVRRHLSAPNRAFSKVIHQPVVDTVSRASAQTVARPSGLLGGSVFAFIGSTFFLIMAKHYGFTYNYLLFILFFVGGFAFGLVLELVLFAFRRKKA